MPPLWTPETARKYAEENGPDALDKQAELENTWPVGMKPFPAILEMLHRTAAQVRREEAAKATVEAKERYQAEMELARQQTSISERQAAAAEDSTRASVRSADAAVTSAIAGEKSAEAAVRSAYAGERAADAADKNANIAKDALKWARWSAISASVAIPISILAVIVAWLKD